MELRGKVATLLNEVLVLVGQKNPTSNAQCMVGFGGFQGQGWITDEINRGVAPALPLLSMGNLSRIP